MNTTTCTGCGTAIEHVRDDAGSRWVHTLTGWSLCDHKVSHSAVASPR